MKTTFQDILSELKKKRLSETTSEDHPLSTSNNSSWHKKFQNQQINTQLQKDIDRANYKLIYPSIPHIDNLTTDIILVYFYKHDHLHYSQGIPDIASFFIHLAYTENKETLYNKCESLLNAMEFALDEEESENDVKLDLELSKIHDSIINSDFLDDKYRPDVSPSVYAKKWFKTLFVRHFNKELVEFIWMNYILDSEFNVRNDVYRNCLHCFCTILLSIRRKISYKLEDDKLYSSEDALLAFMSPTLSLKKFKELKKEAEVITESCLNN